MWLVSNGTTRRPRHLPHTHDLALVDPAASLSVAKVIHDRADRLVDRDLRKIDTEAGN